MTFSCFSNLILLCFAYIGPKYLSKKAWKVIFFIKGIFQSQQYKNKLTPHLIVIIIFACPSKYIFRLKTVRIWNSNIVLKKPLFCGFLKKTLWHLLIAESPAVIRAPRLCDPHASLCLSVPQSRIRAVWVKGLAVKHSVCQALRTLGTWTCWMNTLPPPWYKQMLLGPHTRLQPSTN